MITFFTIFLLILSLTGGYILHVTLSEKRRKKLLHWIKHRNFNLSARVNLKIKEPGSFNFGGYSSYQLLADKYGVYLIDEKCNYPIIFLNEGKSEHVRYFNSKFNPYFFDIENGCFIVKGSMAYKNFLSLGIKELKFIFESPKEISEALEIAEIKI